MEATWTGIILNSINYVFLDYSLNLGVMLDVNHHNLLE